LKFRWATFCRGIALEPDTNEATLIGVIPFFDVQIGAPEGQEHGPFPLPIPLWIHSEFIVVNPPTGRIKVTVKLEFQLREEKFEHPIILTLNPGLTFAFLNIRVHLPNGLPVISGLQTLIGTFSYNGESIGKVELPLTVKVTTNKSLPTGVKP
jgi:hypothetical protein